MSEALRQRLERVERLTPDPWRTVRFELWLRLIVEDVGPFVPDADMTGTPDPQSPSPREPLRVPRAAVLEWANQRGSDQLTEMTRAWALQRLGERTGRSGSSFELER